MNLRFVYRGLKARYRDDRCELAALIGALRPDNIAVDVGANKGSYLWSLSRAVPNGRVIAFEPQPRLADYLSRACIATGLRNVVVENAGVSEQNGNMTLAIPGEGDSPCASFELAVRSRESCRTIEVQVYSLDEYFASEKARIGALKIDVEGHELSVLQGATMVLAKHAPLIVCECESRHMSEGNIGTVLDFFRDHSYDGFFVQRSRLVPISEFKSDIHQMQVGERFWDSPDYCNNFILKRVG